MAVWPWKVPFFTQHLKRWPCFNKLGKSELEKTAQVPIWEKIIYIYIYIYIYIGIADI